MLRLKSYPLLRAEHSSLGAGVRCPAGAHFRVWTRDSAGLVTGCVARRPAPSSSSPVPGPSKALALVGQRENQRGARAGGTSPGSSLPRRGLGSGRGRRAAMGPAPTVCSELQ